MEKICPVCKKEPANKHHLYGVLPGDNCKKRRLANRLPNIQVEFTSESIKSQRKEYGKSIVQPYRSGQLSKEYLDAHGTKGINPTAKEIKNAKPVWSEDFGRNFDISKAK